MADVALLLAAVICAQSVARLAEALAQSLTLRARAELVRATSAVPAGGDGTRNAPCADDAQAPLARERGGNEQ